MARRAHEYGANALLLNAGGIYAFYPTESPSTAGPPAWPATCWATRWATATPAGCG